MSLEEYQKKKEAEKDKITLGQPREAKEKKGKRRARVWQQRRKHFKEIRPS